MSIQDGVLIYWYYFDINYTLYNHLVSSFILFSTARRLHRKYCFQFVIVAIINWNIIFLMLHIFLYYYVCVNVSGQQVGTVLAVCQNDPSELLVKIKGKTSISKELKWSMIQLECFIGVLHDQSKIAFWYVTFENIIKALFKFKIITFWRIPEFIFVRKYIKGEIHVSTLEKPEKLVKFKKNIRTKI